MIKKDGKAKKKGGWKRETRVREETVDPLESLPLYHIFFFIFFSSDDQSWIEKEIKTV